MSKTACLQGEGEGCQLSPAQVGEVGHGRATGLPHALLQRQAGVHARSSMSHGSGLVGAVV